jgi:hypothetical protein
MLSPSLYPTSFFGGHIKEPGEPAPTLVKILKCFRMLLTLGNMASLILNKDPEIDISCSQWEGSACTQSAQIFKFLSFGLGGEGFQFSIFLCSQHVVLIRFPVCSLRVFPIAPYVLPKVLPFSPI